MVNARTLNRGRFAAMLGAPAAVVVFAIACAQTGAADVVASFDLGTRKQHEVLALAALSEPSCGRSRPLQVLPADGKGVLVVKGTPTCGSRGHLVRRFAADTRFGQWVTFPSLWPTAPAKLTAGNAETDAALEILTFSGGNRITAGAAGAQHTFLGTYFGPIRSGANGCEWLHPQQDGPPSLSMTVDGDGGLWVRGYRGRTLADADGAGLRTVLTRFPPSITAGKPIDAEQQGRRRTWVYRDIPTLAITGDPSGPSAWVYCGAPEGGRAICRATASAPAAQPWRAPYVTVTEAMRVPCLEAALLSADAQGHVYLAGDTLDGSKVYLFDGETIDECSPPSDLLRGRRFTAVVVHADNRLHAATDGVGVLVYDNEKWQEHPINEHLPTVAGTGLKPVHCMTFDRAGNLWVGMDDNVICWREEE